MDIILLVISLLQFLFILWIKAELESSVRNQYDKNLEDYKNLYLRKEQSSKIAELFATWITKKEGEDKNDKYIRYKSLNQLSFELTLWIPDEKLLKEVMERLSNKPNAKEVKEILMSCREMIQDKENSLIKAQDIVHF
ncbi:MAG: hypothetical protein PHE21_00385 [Candidatus Dojkabacteria bacterium]|nr:hypothetical protein [Candidatus Dojkabacteria bacterium]